MIRGFLILSLLVTAQGSFAVSLKEIKKAIKDKGASWQAVGGRHFSLDRKVKERMLGAILEDEPNVHFENLDERKGKDLPNEVDWRNRGGINYVSAIKDQGRCGSCVSFAAIATMETQINIANKFPFLDLNLSEQFLWSCDGGGCEQGWIPALAARALERRGTTDEACYPYKAGASGEHFECKGACSGAKARNYKISDYRNVGGWFSSKEDLMEALADGPMLISMKVYEDFLAYESGVYEHVTGEYLGGHAVSLVGYNKAEKYWIVKNSWGEDFGEKGFFRIKMGDSGIGSTSYQFEIAPADGMAKITSPKIGEVLKGSKKFEMSSSIEADKMELEMNTENARHILQTKKNADGSFFTVFDTAGIKDGVYEARAVATITESGTTRKVYSPFKQIFVLNNKPTLTIRTSNPIEEGEKASENVYFIADIEATPIPVQQVAIVIENAAGEREEVFNNVPGAKTKIKWKTEKFENGKYTVWVEAKIRDHAVSSEKFTIEVEN